MHDIVIRGGTIVDGTGKATFTGDVAITGEYIAAVGGKQGPGRREIDATGLLVTPGWVDVHTHHDGQAMWDPLLNAFVLAWRHDGDVRQLLFPSGELREGRSCADP